MHMPLISIIIPCYNVSEYIDRCLASVAGQTLGMDALEIICVDDASTDGTLEKLKVWEEKYPETMILIPLAENGRQGRARNIGLSYAAGEWIAFLDADDWMEPDYLKQLYEAAAPRRADMAVCGFIRDFSSEITCRDERQTLTWRYVQIDSAAKRKTCIRFMSQSPNVWGKLIRKDFLLQNGIAFPERLAYEDNVFSSLLYAYVESYCQTDMPLYHYFVNRNSTILKMNESYHIDFLTVQCMKWKEWKARGFYEQYREELEFDFLHACYLDFLKIICLRFDPPSYSLFLLLKETVLSYLPDYMSNPYIDKGFTDFQHLLLDAISRPISKAQFLEIAGYVKKIGI